MRPFVAEVVVDGLEVPWALAFLPEGGLLVTERPGRLRLVTFAEDGSATLVPEPVITIDVAAEGEGGLLGLALAPDFETSRVFFMYRTSPAMDENIIERFVLDPLDDLTDDFAGLPVNAHSVGIVLDGIPGNVNHNGGRLRVGPDENLWATTGDAQEPARSRDPDDLAGKVLRMTTAGEPIDGSFVAVSGIRNAQGLGFRSALRLVVADHGPSGEEGRTGHDELAVVTIGEDLGWPEADACTPLEGVRSPLLVFQEALPPGAVAVVDSGPGQRAFVTALGAEKLLEIDLDTGGTVVHLDGTNGRLRDVVVGLDRALWLTTSNCDGRGECPAGGDQILRLPR